MNDLSSLRRAGAAEAVSALGDNILEIDHVAIAVPDLEAAIAWYTGNLGFQVLERRTTRGVRTSMTSAVLAAGKALVVLVQGGEPESQVSRFVTEFGPGVQHLALSVADLDRALDDLSKGGGATDTEVLCDAGIRQVFLRRDECSGVRIELIERKGGAFTDESVLRLFRSMEEAEIY